MPNKQQNMGAPVARYKGLIIYARLREPKTERGRPRLWVVIRQDEGRKRWRITENLSYVNGVDIQFVDPLPECPEPTVHRRTGTRRSRHKRHG